MKEELKAENQKNEQRKKVKKKPSILFKVNKKGLHVSPCMSFLRICILPLVRLFYPFKYVGNKKVENGACIYVSNHYRMIDPMYILPTTKEGVHFIAKNEAKKIPIFGAFISAVKTIFVGRDGTDARAIMDALKCLKSGDKVAIYPEGTRNKSDQPFLPFKSGSALLAIRAQVPIVPMVVYQKARFLRKNYIVIGEPFELSEYYGMKMTEELLKEADGKILAVMEDLREKHKQALTEKKGKRN
jgi:1-acyl-sn-glycerol-3-phosphate acyltransferase